MQDSQIACNPIVNGAIGCQPEGPPSLAAVGTLQRPRLSKGAFCTAYEGQSR
jgi:hypothetical protein